MLAYRRRRAERYLVYFADQVFIYAQPSVATAWRWSDTGIFVEAERVWNDYSCQFDALIGPNEEYTGFVQVGKLRCFHAPEDFDTEEFAVWKHDNFVRIQEADLQAAREKLTALQERNDELDRFDKILDYWRFDDTSKKKME